MDQIHLTMPARPNCIEYKRALTLLGYASTVRFIMFSFRDPHLLKKKTINSYTIDLKFLISETLSFWIFFVKFLIYEVFSEVIYARNLCPDRERYRQPTGRQNKGHKNDSTHPRTTPPLSVRI